MPIRFRCPMCGGILSIARRKAGSQVTCPKCEYEVTVPETDEVPAASELEPMPPSAPASLQTHGQRSATSPKPDVPLFERDDIEQLFASVTVPEPEPAAPPAPALPAIENGIALSYGTTVILGLLVAVLLAMAFMTGYLVGR